MVAASEFAAKFGPEVAQLVFFDVLLPDCEPGRDYFVRNPGEVSLTKVKNR
jgi:hypothetical protein